MNLRNDLYEAILRKHVGWFDDKENSPGSLNEALSTEVRTVNSLSAQAIGTMIESMFGLLFAIVVGCYYSWKMTLVSFACVPVTLVSFMITNKVFMNQSTKSETDTANADNILSESIINH